MVFRRTIYDSNRLAGFLAIYPHAKKGTLRQPHDIWPFSFEADSNKPVKAEIPDNLEELLDKMDRF